MHPPICIQYMMFMSGFVQPGQLGRELFKCSDFINGSEIEPSFQCCSRVRIVWYKHLACFYKLTFFSHFFDPGPAQALERPWRCTNILDYDLCEICPTLLQSLSFNNLTGNAHSSKDSTDNALSSNIAASFLNQPRKPILKVETYAILIIYIFDCPLDLLMRI